MKERVQTGLYEQSSSSYLSPVFLVLKQDKKTIHISQNLQQLNSVTIRDAGLPPKIEELVDSMAWSFCYRLADIFGGYNQRELEKISRPLTAFETMIGTKQLTLLPQGATNSVAVYQAQMAHVLEEEIPDHAAVFIDDGGIMEERRCWVTRE